MGASASQIDLAWTDNSVNETGFEIERSLSSQGPYTLIAVTGPNVTAYSDTGLDPNTRYFYRVRAVNSSGESAYSNRANDRTGPAGPTPTVTPTPTITQTPTATATPTVTPTPGPNARGYFTLAPCRVADTRGPAGTFGGPALSGGVPRSFPMTGQCGIPASATAISLNVTVTGPTSLGHLTIYASGSPVPLAATINFRAGQTRGNNAIVAPGPNGAIAVISAQPAAERVHVILDVNGYFQ